LKGVGDGRAGGDVNTEAGGVGVGEKAGKWVGDGVSKGELNGKGDFRVGAGVASSRVSDKVVWPGVGKIGGEVGEGIWMRSEAEAIASVGVGCGGVEGVSCRKAVVGVFVGRVMEPASGTQPKVRTQKQRI
jgi:hypothetical protein